MSYNQGIIRGLNIPEGALPRAKEPSNTGVFHIIIISRNERIQSTLSRTLEHFALSGRSISVLHADSLKTAQEIIEKHRDTILVVIDDNVQVNGSYSVFVDYVHNQLNIDFCHITFKENLIRPAQQGTVPFDFLGRQAISEFECARNRLIDVTRMIMMTTEMETKIDEKDNDGSLTTDRHSDYRLTRDRLYSILAHDLKEPVGNIKVLLDFLTNEPDFLDQQSSQDLLFRVKESANSVHELLEDFLFWSRMIKQDVYFNPCKVDIGLVIRENILLLKSLAAAKDISLSYNIPESTFTYADEYMLHTIVRNLLYNAVKFTQTAGQIEITTNRFDDFYEVVIQDNGIGISPEGIEKIFLSDEVYSADGCSKEGGNGLGLILCRDFVEKNGGEIWVESEKNKGSVFRFTLPKYK